MSNGKNNQNKKIIQGSEENQLQELVKKKQEEKIKKFVEAYNKLCDEHGCGMAPQIIFAAGRNPHYSIVPLIAQKK